MTRRVEFTEKKCLIGTQTYYFGDIKTFPKEIGDMIVNAGHGKDADTGEQKERNLKPVSVQLNPSSMEFLKT